MFGGERVQDSEHATAADSGSGVVLIQGVGQSKKKKRKNKRGCLSLHMQVMRIDYTFWLDEKQGEHFQQIR